MVRAPTDPQKVAPALVLCVEVDMLVAQAKGTTAAEFAEQVLWAVVVVPPLVVMACAVWHQLCESH